MLVLYLVSKVVVSREADEPSSSAGVRTEPRLSHSSCSRERSRELLRTLRAPATAAAPSQHVSQQSRAAAVRRCARRHTSITDRTEPQAQCTL